MWKNKSFHFPTHHLLIPTIEYMNMDSPYLLYTVARNTLLSLKILFIQNYLSLNQAIIIEKRFLTR